MRIEVKAITRAKKEEIQRISGDTYRIKISTPPEKGKANQRIIQLVSDKFGVKRRDVRIISGETSSRKIIEIKNG